MKIWKYILVGALCFGPMTALQSCGDDDPDPTENGSDVNDPSGATDPSNPSEPGNNDVPTDPTQVSDPVAPSKDEKPSAATPEESKKNIENAGVKASEQFKAEDQKPVTDWAQEFSEMFEDFDMPEAWDVYGETGKSFNINKPVRNIYRAVKNCSPADLTRAAAVYVYNFGMFTGEFEPGNEEWVKTKDSKDIVFRYTNRVGQPVVITITGEGTNKEFSVDIEDYDEYEDRDYSETYKITAPRKVTLTVTQGNTTLVNTLVSAYVDEEGHSVDAQVKGTFANLTVNAVVNGTDTKISSKAVVAINNTMVVSEAAQVNGKKMATRSAIENLIDNPTAANYDAMFTNAIANANVLGEVQVKASGEKVGEIIRAFDIEKEWDSYDYDNSEAARQDCQRACDVANKNVLGRVYFNGSNDYSAVVKLMPVYDSNEYSWWEWEVLPALYFNDGTSYLINEYFGNGRFASVEDSWSKVWDAYQALWR